MELGLGREERGRSELGERARAELDQWGLVELEAVGQDQSGLAVAQSEEEGEAPVSELAMALAW